MANEAEALDTARDTARELVDHTMAQITKTVNSSKDPRKFFPNGITKISVSLKVKDLVDISFSIEGPTDADNLYFDLDEIDESLYN